MRQNILFLLGISIVAAMTMVAGFARAQTPDTASGGLTVVELFTSQGCSSCPPADRLLGELASQHPNDVLALSYHVDYWNYIGWKDPFSKPAFSEYQRNYASARNSRRVYTPQMMINGRHDVVGSHKSDVLGNLAKAKGETKPLSLTKSQGPDAGTVSINVSSDAGLIGANILLARYTPTHTTKVNRGENRGRSLTNYNIVNTFEKIGTYQQTGNTFTIAKLDQQAGAVLLQDPKSMQILAAAKF